MNKPFITTINPRTAQTIDHHPLLSTEELKKRLDQLDQAQKVYQKEAVSKRVERLAAICKTLTSRREEFARVISQEMGKHEEEARQEIDKCHFLCETFRDQAPSMLAQETYQLGDERAVVSYHPLGVILLIMPWNYPFWQVFRAAIPALLSGNGVVLKHAENTTRSALLLEEVLGQEFGFKDLFQTFVISRDQTEQLLGAASIKAVSFTGSARAGREIASIAGKHLKKCVLELGGSDPYLILEDADLKESAKKIAQSRMANCGQSCIAAKRILIHSAVFESFTTELKNQLEPFMPTSEGHSRLAPLARQDLLLELDRQVKDSVAKGAKCLLGGVPLAGPGFFYPPTMLTKLSPGMPAYDEELFGPVFSLIPFQNEQDALSIANGSLYGLGGGVFTQNTALGAELALRGLQAGNTAVNGIVKSDPRLPFGGIKASGYGRELGKFGMWEFVNIKTTFLS